MPLDLAQQPNLENHQAGSTFNAVTTVAWYSSEEAVAAVLTYLEYQKIIQRFFASFAQAGEVSPADLPGKMHRSPF